jgi:hypothetical protein
MVEKASGAASELARLVARDAAVLQNRYSDLWPETIRSLLVHSADWTETMKAPFLPLNSREQKERLLRYCGYGVPDFQRASWSASNELTLIAQDDLQPFEKRAGGGYKSKDINLHTLPWPSDVLSDLGDTEVQLRVTLSYFVEPNPARRGWRGRYRYASHGLGLTDILYQRDRDYCIAVVPSRWDNGGAKACGAGGRYPSDECGLTVL